MNLPQRKYTTADSDRLELNVSAVESILTKYRMTLVDLLTGLRYQTPKFRWEESVEAAGEACIAYENYKGINPELTKERYDTD